MYMASTGEYQPDINRPEQPEKQRAVINVLLVYLLIYLSGSWRYNLLQDPQLVAGFLLAMVAWLMFSDRKFSEAFLLYVAVFTGLLLALSLYTGGSLTLTSAISSAMKMVIAYLIIRTVREKFVETYVNVIVFLAVVSLFGYMTDRFNLFDGIIRSLPRVSNLGFEGLLYVYRFPWHIERNNSIFFEPGAYQAFLNAALFVLFFLKLGFSRRKTLTYIVILLATLVTTFSTTGFIIFLAMFPAVLYKSQLLTTKGKLKLVGAGVVVVMVFSAQFYTTFLVKINDYLNANEYEFTYSAQARSAGTKTDIKVFKQHPFGLGQRDYARVYSEVGRVDLEKKGTSPNGVTKIFAIYGLPFALFIFGSYFWALKKLLRENLLVIVAYVMFLLFLAGESYYMASPVTFALIASAFIYRAADARNTEPTYQAVP